MGLSIEELAWLASDDEAFDARSEQIRQLHPVWRELGVLTMLRRSLHLLALPAAENPRCCTPISSAASACAR